MTDMTKDIVGRLADAMVAHVQQVLHDYGIPDDTIRNDPEIASATREAVSSALESLSPPDGVGLETSAQERDQWRYSVNPFTVEDKERLLRDFNRIVARLLSSNLDRQEVEAAIAAEKARGDEVEQRIASHRQTAMERQRRTEAKAECMEAVLRDAKDNGLIYWEPNTERGSVQKALMLARIDAALAAKEAEAKHWHECWMAEQDLRDKDRAERDALKAALEPSSATKAAYIGEVTFRMELREGESREITVPWTTTKEIMAMIRAYADAALSPAQGGE